MRFIRVILLILLLFPTQVMSDGPTKDLLPEKTSVGVEEVSSGQAPVTEPGDGVPWGFVVLLFMLSGFLFMFMEIAVIPGFGITGILGILLLLGGLVGAYLKLSTAMAVFATVAAIVGVVMLLMWFFLVFPHTRLGKQFVLQADSAAADGYIAVEDNQRYLGKEGVAATILRPSGIARIEGERLDVITDGQFVEKGVSIKVVRTVAGRIIVAPIEVQD